MTRRLVTYLRSAPTNQWVGTKGHKKLIDELSKRGQREEDEIQEGRWQHLEQIEAKINPKTFITRPCFIRLTERHHSYTLIKCVFQATIHQPKIWNHEDRGISSAWLSSSCGLCDSTPAFFDDNPIVSPKGFQDNHSFLIFTNRRRRENASTSGTIHYLVSRSRICHYRWSRFEAIGKYGRFWLESFGKPECLAQHPVSGGDRMACLDGSYTSVLTFCIFAWREYDILVLGREHCQDEASYSRTS